MDNTQPSLLYGIYNGGGMFGPFRDPEAAFVCKDLIYDLVMHIYEDELPIMLSADLTTQTVEQLMETLDSFEAIRRRLELGIRDHTERKEAIPSKLYVLKILDILVKKQKGWSDKLADRLHY
jgi:hypothetical protein